MMLLIPAILLLSCHSSTGPDKVITCVDIDGNSYEFVTIGDQVWMAENLRTAHYQNGDPIPTGLSDGDWLNSRNNGAFSVYNEDPANALIYGNLYNWYAVDDDRGVCPEGWHVPNYEEWQDLADEFGGNSLAGGALMSTDLINGFGDIYSDATNESGFSALSGGYRRDNGHYSHIGDACRFWSVNSRYDNDAWYIGLDLQNPGVWVRDEDRLEGYSVRCVEGTTPEYQSPFLPFNPIPHDGSTNEDDNTILFWEGGDPDGDAVTYDVYVEVDNPDPSILVASGLTEASFSFSTYPLENLHYYWKVIASDGYLTKTGPVWEFWVYD